MHPAWHAWYSNACWGLQALLLLEAVADAAACRELFHLALLGAGAASAAPAAEVKQAYSIKAPNGVRDQTHKVKNAACAGCSCPVGGGHAVLRITSMQLFLGGTAQKVLLYHVACSQFKSPCSACMHACMLPHSRHDTFIQFSFQWMLWLGHGSALAYHAASVAQKQPTPSIHVLLLSVVLWVPLLGHTNIFLWIALGPSLLQLHWGSTALWIL